MLVDMGGNVLQGADVTTSEGTKYEWDLPSYLSQADALILKINSENDGEALSPLDWHIYTRLIIYCNKTGWRLKMSIPASMMETITGATRATVNKSRARLQSVGLLHYTPGKPGTQTQDGQARAAVYRLLTRAEMAKLLQEHDIHSFWGAVMGARQGKTAEKNRVNYTRQDDEDSDFERIKPEDNEDLFDVIQEMTGNENQDSEVKQTTEESKTENRTEARTDTRRPLFGGLVRR